jgi:transposase-like protein
VNNPIGVVRAHGRSIDELAPGERKVRITQSAVLQFSEEQKKEAVLSLCTRDTSAGKVAEEQGINSCNLYAWKRKLLGKESEAAMNQGAIALPDSKDELWHSWNH